MSKQIIIVNWTQLFRGSPWRKIIGAIFPLHLCHMKIQDGPKLTDVKDVYYIEVTKEQHDMLLKVPSGKHLKHGTMWDAEALAEFKDTRHSGAEE